MFKKLFHNLALGKMEELLLDMKTDVSRLSIELTKMPSVSSQLKIDELSILGKLAGKDQPVTATTNTTTTTTKRLHYPSPL